ncbi:MAG: AAA family ATPase [Chitinophagaceae bacterium]
MATQYIEEMFINRCANVPVIVTRTKEPRRALDLLLSYSDTREIEKVPIYTWDPVKSWKRLKRSNKKDIPSEWVDLDGQDGDDKDDYLAAIKTAAKFEEAAMCVMYGYHEWWNNDPSLKNSITFFGEMNSQTLVFIVPQGEPIPPELDSDVCLMELPLPNVKELSAIVAEVVGAQRFLSPAETFSLASAACGMTAVEASRAYSKVLAKYVDTLDNVDINELLHGVYKSKEEIIRKSGTLQLYQSVSESEVGGVKGLKHWLEFNKVRMDPANIEKGAAMLQGVLLVGPPGTGKSLLAKVIASKLNLPLIRLDVGALFGGLVGESEKKTAQAMETIRAVGRCVVWIDEIDKAGLSAGAGGDSGASSRLLASLLFYMQEMDTGVFWVPTANRVENIPMELLRPGRLDEKFFIDLPDESAREEIFRIHLHAHKQSDDFDLSAVVEASHDHIGSEIKKAVIDSVTYCLNNDCEMSPEILYIHSKAINPTSIAFEKEFKEMREWGKNNAIDAAIVPESNIATVAKPRPQVKPVVVQKPIKTIAKK